MALHWGSQFIATCLPEDMKPRLGSIQCDPFYEAEHGKMPPVRFCNGATGETLTDIEAAVMWRVSRKRTKEFFSEGLDIQVSLTPSGIILLIR